MKKTYSISDLDCVVCANNLEKKLGTISGVKSVSINYFLQSLTLEADDAAYADILKHVKRAIDHAIPGAKLL